MVLFWRLFVAVAAELGVVGAGGIGCLRGWRDGE